jgi:hypothetical protein
MRALNTLLWCASVMWLGTGAALAHKGSDAYLDVQQVGTEGASPAHRDLRFVLAVALKDLDLVLPLDANADGKITWGEAKAATPQVLALLNDAANIATGTTDAPVPTNLSNPCHLSWQADGVERRSDGAYLRLAAQARCPATRALAFNYTLFREQDANHRLLVAGRIAGADLLTTTSPQQQAPLVLNGGTAATASPAPVSRWAALRDYFLLGAHHLLEGYDHLAFLLALVLPLQLNLRLGSRVGTRQSLHPDRHVKLPGELPGLAMPGTARQPNVWMALLGTITAFTLGHSITLMLATLGWTQASPVWVEPVIAASIAVTALLNLRPQAWLRTDVLALLFGLVHGFGFAGLLQEAAAPTGLLPWALAGFNLGVEAGQLMAVSAWVLVSQLVVGRSWYASVVVRGGSIALSVLAAWWFWQRVS